MSPQSSARQPALFSCLLAARHLQERKQFIIERFVQAARQELRAAQNISREELINNLPAFLVNLTNALKLGGITSYVQENANIGKTHGAFRASQKLYSLNDILIEYRLLNQVILNTLRESSPLEAQVEDVISDFIHLGITSSSSEFMRIQRQVEEARLKELEQTRLVIQESEHRFRQIANAMPQIVWTARSDGFVDWYNDWWYEYTGVSHGSNWYDTSSPMHPDDIQPTWDRWNQSLRTGKPYETEYRFRRHSDGQYRWHLGRAVPVRDENGKILRWIGSNTDIQDQKIAEKEAQSARQELHDFIMQSPSPMVILLGPEYRFALANPPYERLIGGKVTGKTVREVFSPEAANFYIPLIDSVYQTGEPYIGKELPLHIPDQNGVSTLHFVNFAYHPFRNSTGKIRGILADVHDATEQVEARKKVEESERRYRLAKEQVEIERTRLYTAFSQAPIGIAVLRGPDLIIEFANRTYRKLVGENRKIDGLPLEIAFSDLNRDPIEYTRHPYITGERKALEALPATADWDQNGKPYEKIFYVIYEPLIGEDGKPEGVIVTAFDDTEKVRNRQKVEQTLTDLKAERDLRDKFVATLTHDLRTPLTAAKMSAQILARKPDEPASVQRLASRVVDNVDRADRMIRDLLDANRIKAGEPLPLEIAHCDLNQLALETLQELSTIHGDRFVLEAVSKITGYWSCGGIRRILENLCNNAIKYGLSHGPVTVSLLVNPQFVEIQVHNLGSPIPLKDQPKLFEAFSRANTALAGQQKGWGLGLALVKGIAEAHGGSVSLESSEEQLGTTFCVRLPLDARKAAAS